MRHRERREKPALPPRKKDWTEGHDQVGLFIRTKDGSVIEAVWHQAPQEIVRLAGLMVADTLGVRDFVESPAKEVDEVPAQN